jgi:hypothetical protein
MLILVLSVMKPNDIYHYLDWKVFYSPSTSNGITCLKQMDPPLKVPLERVQ